ncbi:hypothetical protein KPH14_001268 [Odynerus spinipes]|uniref:Uncharacterized protein n=1 Tax=Odynerus spinipes TaxID=1348599 RepID=A0AAD9RG60_9HYME|nr:hypothetical protein KPH14_001268 [Odynerus spinipes]
MTIFNHQRPLQRYPGMHTGPENDWCRSHSTIKVAGLGGEDTVANIASTAAVLEGQEGGEEKHKPATQRAFQESCSAAWCVRWKARSVVGMGV